MANKPGAESKQSKGKRANKEITDKMLKELCTVREAAKILGVSQQQVRVLIDDGRIDAVQLDEWFWVVDRPSLNRYLETKSRRGRPPAGSKD